MQRELISDPILRRQPEPVDSLESAADEAARMLARMLSKVEHALVNNLIDSSTEQRILGGIHDFLKGPESSRWDLAELRAMERVVNVVVIEDAVNSNSTANRVTVAERARPSMAFTQEDPENQIPAVRSGSRPGTTRMSLDVTPQMKASIDQMADEAGVPKADILRQAVSVLKVLKTAARLGQHPALIDDKGNLIARIVGL